MTRMLSSVSPAVVTMTSTLAARFAISTVTSLQPTIHPLITSVRKSATLLIMAVHIEDVAVGAGVTTGAETTIGSITITINPILEMATLAVVRTFSAVT